MIDAHWICVRLIERQQTEEGLDSLRCDSVANRRKGQEGDGRVRLAPPKSRTPKVKEEGEQDLRSIFLAL